MALLLQRVGHLVVALRYPQQRAHGIAERGRLDDAAQVRDQRRVPARQMPPAAALAALTAFRQRRGVEVLQSPTDGRARQPRHRGDRPQAAPSSRANLAGREHPPPPLIELRANQLPSLPNRLRVDHADPHTAPPTSQESQRPESNHHIARNAIRFIYCDECPYVQYVEKHAQGRDIVELQYPYDEPLDGGSPKILLSYFSMPLWMD